jgi:hypothetical protein
VAGPLVPAQMEAGTKGSWPKALFPLVIYMFSSFITLRFSFVRYTYVVACLLFGGLSRLGSSKETESASCWRWTLGVVGVGCVIFLYIKQSKGAETQHKTIDLSASSKSRLPQVS